MCMMENSKEVEVKNTKLQPVFEEEDENINIHSVEKEVKKQLWLSAPLIGLSLHQYSLQVISIMFVGHLGSLTLCASSIGTSFTAVTGFSFLMGAASALETLFGQSCRAKTFGKLGIYMQRAIIVLLILEIPLSVILVYTENILVFFNQDRTISRLAGTYARYMIPSIFAYAILQCQTRFLQTQNKVYPVLVCSGVTTCLHVLLCWVLVLKFDFGHKGAALAISISYWLNVILLSCYIKFSYTCSQTWTGFSKEALSHIPAFVKLCFPSLVMVCLELWTFELVVLLSGLLPNPVVEISTISICVNTTSLTLLMIPVGLRGTVSTRISSELEAGNPKGAKLAARVVVAIMMAEGIMMGSVLLAVRNKLGYAFSNDPKVITAVASILPIVVAGNFLDGFQCVMTGVVRGCGWHKIGFCATQGSNYLLGIPLGSLLGFCLHLGGRGLRIGVVSGLAVQGMFLCIIIFVINWDKEAMEAKHRVGPLNKVVGEAEASVVHIV